jgi:branched-chain amino acid transport system permease protein
MKLSHWGQTRLVFRIVAIGVVGILLVIVPTQLQGGYYENVLVLACVFATLASNWDLSIGYAGIFTFGQIAVFGVGAYTTAILTTHYAVSPWLALGAAVVVGTAVAAITALPAIRLRGIYVALATFAFTELIVNVIVSNNWTGGQLGITALPDLTVGQFDLNLSDNGIGFLYLAEGLLVASTVFLRLIVRSDLGRRAVAARDSEDYAVSRGISLARTRLNILVLSAIFTALAGGIYAEYTSVSAPDVFNFGFAAELFSMLFVGGLGTIYGPLVAGIALTVLNQSRWILQLNQLGFLISAALILVVMRFLPGGIWGTACDWLDARVRMQGADGPDQDRRLRQ